MAPHLKKDTLLKIMDSTFITLPAPVNLSTMWNFGFLLSFCLISQIITGLLLASYYAPSLDGSFALISYFMESTSEGWLIRYVHTNGASLFFVSLYIHIGRGIYYNSFLMTSTWYVGVTIFLLTMATAFLGYVLPSNQMSYWGASVITNLFSEVPVIGTELIHLIWGSVSISDPTMTRFFMLHFMLPFMILALVAVHLTLLHSEGSSNPLGVKSSANKAQFHLFFSLNDSVKVLVLFTLFMAMCLYSPLTLGDNENFTPANTAVTPHHIQPEWYFLFAYAILRSVPNKLGGVISLALSVLILYGLPFTFLGSKKSSSLYPPSKMLFWLFIVIVILLTWIGARPVESPFIITGQILSALYFMYYLVAPVSMKLWDNLEK